MYRTLNGIGIALILLLMTAGVFAYAAPHFDWRVEAVRSGSMSPEMSRGTLVISQPVRPDSIMVDDIIIFHPVAVGENLVCHRVAAVENTPLQFGTKGDAELNLDPFLVPAENVVGRVVWHIPIVGYVLLFSKTPVGFLLTLIIPGFVITAMCLQNIRLEMLRKNRAKSRPGEIR